MIMNPNEARFVGATPDGIESCATGNYINTPNPMQGWIHMEFYWDAYNGAKFGYSNGSSTGIASNWLKKYITNADGKNPKTISIGGFVRWPRENNTGNYRYWAGIYADNTFSRVILGNNPTWENSTIREPQPPIEWSNNSIKCQVNLGALPDSDEVYLYVFDRFNNYNKNGFQINLGSVQDSQAPMPPFNLKVL